MVSEMGVRFKTLKYKATHFGNNIKNSCTMLDLKEQKRQVLKFITNKKDWGVIIDCKLNFSNHIATQVKKAKNKTKQTNG